MQNHRRYPNRGAHGEAVYSIGRSIVGRYLKPGDLLPEAELIAELNVSRTVFRESIKVLAAKGLVESKPRVGTTVRPRNCWRLLDPDVLAWQTDNGLDELFLRNLVEVRYVIEPPAARFAATRASKDELQVIESAYEQMEAHIVHSEAFVAADMQFHYAILAACHNEILEEMGATIGEALEISRRVTVETPGSPSAHLPLHKAVVDAIRTQDSHAAESAMTKLLERVQADVNRFVQCQDSHVEEV